MTHKHATTVRAIEAADGEVMLRFIGGRNRFNRLRAIAADRRRREVVRLLAGANLKERGWQARIARELGVHRSTVCRDIVAIARQTRRQRAADIDRDFERRETFLNRLLLCENPELSQELFCR